MKKAFISKSSVYGIINALFIIGEGIFNRKYNWIEYVQIVTFSFGYVSIFFERRRENHIKKKKTEKQLIKYMVAQEDEQLSKLYYNKVDFESMNYFETIQEKDPEKSSSIIIQDDDELEIVE